MINSDSHFITPSVLNLVCKSVSFVCYKNLRKAPRYQLIISHHRPEKYTLSHRWWPLLRDHLYELYAPYGPSRRAAASQVAFNTSLRSVISFASPRFISVFILLYSSEISLHYKVPRIWLPYFASFRSFLERPRHGTLNPCLGCWRV